jgi:hypothetical protein
MSALLISEQMFTVGTKQLARTGNYAAFLPGAMAIGLEAAELSGSERTIFIFVQS